MGAWQSSDRFATGAEFTIVHRQIDDIDIFTEDSDPDSDDSDDIRMDSEDEMNQENNDEVDSEPQDVKDSFEMHELRVEGVTQIFSKGPVPSKIQDFWHQIIEKRIPTVLMCCDFIREGQRVCAQYIPKSHETSRICGIYTVERIGRAVSLTANLQRQQLLVYRTHEKEPYKHKVMHFQMTEWFAKSRDAPLTARNYSLVRSMASRQPNPQVLFHGTWSDDVEKMEHQ